MNIACFFQAVGNERAPAPSVAAAIGKQYRIIVRFEHPSQPFHAEMGVADSMQNYDAASRRRRWNKKRAPQHDSIVCGHSRRFFVGIHARGLVIDRSAQGIFANDHAYCDYAQNVAG